MSFTFNWNSFNEENFYSKAKTLLTNALNRSNKPPIIVDKIDVKDLYLGENPPNLEILEIGDLADDRFRGIFKLNYSGDASITLTTKVQANLLNVYEQNAPSFSLPEFLGASSSLAMPLNLTLSDIKLSGIIILVYSKAKGLTLVFRNDPLESIKVSSTFDALPGIAKFLQVQIENQIRILFREELPSILHKLSHRWTPSGAIISASGTSTPTSSSPKPKPVSLVEINPELPALSPTNMLRLDTLMASQRTLSLFTPTIPDVICRSNLEQFEKDSKSKQPDIQSITNGDDYMEIMKIQSKNFARTSHKQPKRRVIKLNKKKEESAEKVDEPIATTVEKKPLPVPEHRELDVPTHKAEAVATHNSNNNNNNPASTTWTSSKMIQKDKAFSNFFSSNVATVADMPPPYTA